MSSVPSALVLQNRQDVIKLQSELGSNLSVAMLADFETFLTISFTLLNNEPPKISSKISEICKKLTDIAWGNNVKQNLIINIPPRCGKSLILRYFCAYSFCLNRRSNVIYTSYSDKLVREAGDMVRGILLSPIGMMFRVGLSKTFSAMDNFKTQDGGVFMASTIQGSIRGFGAGVWGDEYGGCMVIDDPTKAGELRANADMALVIDKYVNVLKTRINNKNNTPMILIMQRIQTEDLTGYLLQNEPDSWELLKVPALGDDEEPNFPFALQREWLVALRDAESLSHLFATQYQQEPYTQGGNIIRGNWFVRFQDNQVERYITGYLFCTVDTAMKGKDTSDYTCICVWAVHYPQGTRTPNLYLVEVIRKKLNYNDILTECVCVRDRYLDGWHGQAIKYFLVEGTANGVALCDHLKAKGISTAEVNTKGRDKYTRLLAVLPNIEYGRVFVLDGAPWLQAFIQECEAFTKTDKHKYDDQVDCLIYALDHLFRTSIPFEMSRMASLKA